MSNNDYMEDFDPEHMLKFDIEKGGEETYYVSVKEPNKELKGTFMVYTEDDKIDPIINFFVLDPDGNKIVSKKKKSMWHFGFNTTMPGEYQFIFSNIRFK